MARLKLLHFGFGAPELFSSQAVSLRGKGDGFQNSLRNMASHNGLAYLVSPQVGAFWKTLVMLRKPLLKQSKWSGYKNLKNSNFSAFLNFQIKDKSIEESKVWQQFYGYPGLKLLMLRSSKVRVKYLTERKFQQQQEEYKGFEAQIMQQAFEHLEAVDPLMLARDFDIIDPNIKAEHQPAIRQLFDHFCEEKRKVIADGLGFNRYRRTDNFNRLRREIVYSITDHYRR